MRANRRIDAALHAKMFSTNGLVIEAPDLPVNRRFQPLLADGGKALVLVVVASGLPLPPSLAAHAAAGGLELTFPTEAGFNYEIRRSADLSRYVL